MKNKFVFGILLVSIFVLTALAVYLAQTLQTRQAVSPAVPESVPSAAVPDACQVGFLVSPLTCYEGTCENDGQCAEGLVCDGELNVCVNPSCRESEDCECSESLVETPTPTPTPTDTPEVTTSPTPTPTVSPTPTASPTQSPTPASTTQTYTCNSLCNTDADCQSANPNYICYSQTGSCRHKDYPSEANCYPQGSTNSPNPTFPSDVPQSGTGVPTIIGIGVGIILVIGALIFAL